ncbi:glycosyltransferase [Vallitalea guaymasensis]|uniref:Glycosyltransferase n=1 Tax=Vallitalea guaymasensis TaxID=1185412 RepID=A0A8J8SCU9_9FIRM|nr:glycosyltransferase [Vallitalea guaymasensis]QUH30233.1 glycosyltransferase [Vallitalea guaymasensis]
MKKTNVLAFCFKTIPSAIMGIIKPLQLLQKQQLLNFVYKESRHVSNEDISIADVIICIRGAEQLDVDKITLGKNKGKYLIYFLDDDLLNIGGLSRSYNKAYFERKDIKNNIKSIMDICHCLWTTNKNIAEKYKLSFEKVSVTNAPALLLKYDKPDIMGHDNLNETITIGFAGGTDHKTYFNQMMYRPFQSIINKYGYKIKFEIIGFKNYSMKNIPITVFPYRENYEQYVSFLLSRKWDIAVAPLNNTEFHSCKYFNKFLEYSSIGATGIYSNVEPFTYIVKNGENGLLVDNNTIEWTNGLMYLIDNKEKRLDISRNAYEFVKNNFDINKVAAEICSSIPHLVNYEKIRINGDGDKK